MNNDTNTNTNTIKVKPVKKRTLSADIAEQIKQMIQTKQLKLGEKLPGERELATMFEVGRSSVREAILILESIGLVKKTMQGSFISDSFNLAQFDFTCGLFLNEDDYKDLYEARKIIESSTVGLAVVNSDAQDIELLEEISAKMEKEKNINKFALLDLKLHLSIAYCSKNKVLSQLIGTLSDLLRTQMTNKYHISVDKIKAVNNALIQHRQIIDAIKNKDKDKAIRIMYQHLDTAETSFLATKILD
jgi:GntR family transcriptional repressor for pyruvate dehydrogenase complex